jgi:hypothetical protein
VKLSQLPDLAALQAKNDADLESLKAERDKMVKLAEARHRETHAKLDRILSLLALAHIRQDR